ncbi:MAG: MFS transporter, partial [Thaumarchaeota archaeon]
MRILEAKRLVVVFLAISLLSLFADIVYEGARSISGAYLNLLAAPAIAAGVLTIGDLLSNVMRLVGGAAAYKASSGRIYWGLILLGYATNLLIPLLALTGSWEIAL